MPAPWRLILQGARPERASANPKGYVMKALAIGAAAIVILLFPCPLTAQEGAPNITITHVALAGFWRQPTMARLPIVPVDHPATISPPSMVQSSDVAAIGTIKSHAGGGEWAGGTFHLAAMRGRSASGATTGQSFEYRRFAMMAVGADMTGDISARDALTLAGTYAVERRRPAFIVSPHRNYRTDERAVSLHWTRDDRLDLAGTLFDTGPAKQRTAVERIADLAGGAPRMAHGWGLTASLYPSGQPGRLSMGIDFRDQQDGDVQRRDARLQLFLKEKF